MNVVELPVTDFRSVECVLDRARAAGLTDILVIGWDRNRDLWTDTNVADGGAILWLLELCKARLIRRQVT
jgi:hypothetical protein